MKTSITIRTGVVCGAATILAMSGATQAALVFNGDFNMFKPGTGYTVTATFAETGSFVGNTWGDGATVSGTGVVFSDSSTGTTVDIPGWVDVRGNKNLFIDGFEGNLTPAFHGFGSWGGQTLIETASSVGSVSAGQEYTITVQVGGSSSPATGPIDGLLEFNLLANGIPLTPTGFLDVPGTTDGASWYTMSRTYSAASLTGNIGETLKVQVGVASTNTIGNRVVFDNVTFASIPEPSTALLSSIGLLALLRRQR